MQLQHTNHRGLPEFVRPHFPSSSDVLDTPLIKFGPDEKDWWTIRHACSGTQIFGATGSGKTTGSGATIARSFLLNGFGGLVMTAKTDELENWLNYTKSCRRGKSVRVLDPAGQWEFHDPEGRNAEDGSAGEFRLNEDKPPLCFDFLDYEWTHGNGLTRNVVSLFMSAMSTGGYAVSRADPYWDDALREFTTHGTDLAAFASCTESLPKGEVHLDDLVDIMRSAPQSRSDVSSLHWRKHSKCWKLLGKANQKRERVSRFRGRLLDLEGTVKFWLEDFPNLSDRVRSLVVSSFTAKAAGLLRSPLRQLLCGDGEKSDQLHPENTHSGSIIILNLPVKEYGEVGRFAQVLYKTIWQRAVERRRDLKEKLGNEANPHFNPDWRPVFLWADESQYFASREDMLFQQTARSVAAATVYLTQNYPNYTAALGDAGNGATDSLLGNLLTKIFHANGDPITNEYAERIFAKDEKQKSSVNIGYGPNQQYSSNHHHEDASLVPAIKFLKLRRGGPNDNFVVDGIISEGGRIWSSGQTFLEFPFKQQVN